MLLSFLLIITLLENKTFICYFYCKADNTYYNWVTDTCYNQGNWPKQLDYAEKFVQLNQCKFKKKSNQEKIFVLEKYINY